ncbi:MAG: ATP-grasp domain-containing protein [Candidatus Coatesbacteria bacterium]|nr:ATP-grasp domain-containing protein [Candidatus Coatesbacteria bacterium]
MTAANSSHTNILILSANWRADLVKAFQRALSELGGGKVVAADMSPLSAALLQSDEFEVVPPLDSPGFIEHLEGICRKHGISAIIPSIDKDLPFLASHRERLRKNGITAVVSSAETIAICDDKYRTYQFFCDNGIPSPITWLPDELPANTDKLHWPLLVKPRRGIGGKGIYRVADEEELRFYLERTTNAVIQEFLPGVEYSFDTLSDFDGKALSVVPRERLYVRDGEVFKGRTVRNMEFIELVAKAAEALKLIGPAVVQGLLDERGALKLTEANPRFGSGALLSIAAGADLAKDLIRLIRGERIEPKLGRFKDGVYLLRYYDAFFPTAETLPR